MFKKAFVKSVVVGGLVWCASPLVMAQDAETESDTMTTTSDVVTNLEVGVEREWLQLDTQNKTGIQTHLFRAGADFGMESVPVTVGAYAALVNYRDDDVNGAKDSHGNELGVNLKGYLTEELTGLPVGFYLKFEAPLYSEVTLSDSDTRDMETTFSHKSAQKFSLGARFAFVEETFAFAEFAQGKRKYEVEMKDTKAQSSIKTNQSFDTASVTLGLVHAL